MRAITLVIVFAVVVAISIAGIVNMTQTNNGDTEESDVEKTVPSTPKITNYSLSEISNSSSVTTQIESGETHNSFIITINCNNNMVKLSAHFEKAQYNIHYSMTLIESEGSLAAFKIIDGWYGTTLSQWGSSHPSTFLSGNTTNEFVIEFQTSLFIFGEARFSIDEISQ